MSRRERERALLGVVARRTIRTQADLVEALRGEGFDVSQATVSRDVRRLGLVRSAGPDGSYRYARPDPATPSPAAEEAFRTAFREFAVELAEGEGVLAIRTHSGCANAVAVALDETAGHGVVATLAGDDTIFVLTRRRADRDRLLAELRVLL